VHNILFYSSECYVDHPKYVRGLYRLFLKKNVHCRPCRAQGRKGRTVAAQKALRWRRLIDRWTDQVQNEIGGWIGGLPRLHHTCSGSEGYRDCSVTYHRGRQPRHLSVGELNPRTTASARPVQFRAAVCPFNFLAIVCGFCMLLLWAAQSV
jgi:hypothetical protein